MGVETKAPPLKTAASLVTDVLSDLQLLIEQQFQLTRCEIEDEFRQRVFAAAIFGAGLANWLVSLMLASLAAANGIYLVMLPNPKHSGELPLWGCQLGVAGVLCVVGALLITLGRRRFRDVISSQNPATQLFREAKQWTTPSAVTGSAAIGPR
jgi:hypothetical protein